LVIFAHGSGSSRQSPRNRHVAAQLNASGLGTLLVDLLTDAEAERDARTGELRFDIGLLSRRLLAITAWAVLEPSATGARIGYFGASTGAAAALVASSALRSTVGAVVSRGGRPDLAGEALGRVAAPTLLIVGGNDRHVLDLNVMAARSLSCLNRLEVVPGASHLFEEPGALDRVAQLAVDWFSTHLAQQGAGRTS
jgi:dienelactone hydrolase